MEVVRGQRQQPEPAGLGLLQALNPAAGFKQTEAMRQLHDWFADWATTLRTVFGSQECVSLGLSVVRRTASGGEEVVNDDVTTPDSAPAPTTSNPTAPTS